MDELMTISGVCTYTGVSRTTVYRWLDEGLVKLQPKGPGTRVLIRRSDIDRFIERDAA